MADTISYIKVGNENHPIDAITVNGITLTSAEKTVWNNKQDALTFDSIPTENSGNPITSGGIYTVIKDNEYVIAAAINDINTRLTNVESGGGSGSGSGITSESDPTFASSPAAGITAADISNWRSMSSGGITSESDPVFAASVAASITASDISNWNSKTSNTGTLTGVKFNGTNATVSNGVASISVTIPAAQVQSDWNATTGVSAIKNKPTIPAAVTEATVSGWGFTKNTGTLTSESDPVFSASVAASITATDISNWNSKTSNTGTITGISMNGSSKGTSGNVNLGNVVTAVSFNGTSVSPSGGVVTIAESDPVFSASVAASITASDISNWNNKANNGWYVRVGSNLLDGVPIDLYGGGCIHMSGGTNLIIDDNNNRGSVVLYNTMDWSGIVRTSVSTYANVENASDIRTLQDDLNLIYNKVPDVTSANLGKSLVATYDGTNGFHWEASTIRQLPEVTSSDVNGSSGKILVASYDSTNGYHWEKTDYLNLYNNGQISVGGSLGTTYLDTIGVFRNDRASWDWIRTGTSSSSKKTLQSDLDAIRQLPAVTSTQNGQVLQVVNGQWTLVTPVSIYSGSSTPNNSQGTNGDLYLQTS